MIFAPKVRRADGTWSALNTKPLRDWARTLGPMMRQSLATKLQELGLPIIQPLDAEGKPKGWFEVDKVPESLTKAWSPRRNDIESFFESRGQAIGETSAIAREYAALITRPTKPVTPAREVLFAGFADEARQHGFTTQSVEALIHNPKTIPVERAYAQAKQQALEEILAQESVFTWRNLIQETAERMQHIPMTGLEIAAKLRNDLDASPEIIRLGVEEGDERYTTRQFWNVETKLFNDVSAMTERHGVGIDPQRIAEYVTQEKLEGEQAGAFKTLVSGGSAIRCLSGVAGAGKTTVLEPVTRALQESGYVVIGAAVAGAAKEKLSTETGMPARTVASYLHHLDQPWAQGVRTAIEQSTKQMIRGLRGNPGQRHPVELTEKTVLVIDEASMLDTRQTARLIHHAKKAGATVILAGDPKQLPAIGAGAPFASIIEAVGSSAAALSVNFRQQGAIADRDAAHLIRYGKAREALESYAKRGRLAVGENRAVCIADIVQSWTDHGGAKKPESAMIFTQTRSEARTINRLCQGVRQQAGHVDATGILFEGQTYCAGDRILFHKAIRSQGIENGFGATILKIKKATNSAIIRIDNPLSAEARARGARQFTTISLSDLPAEALSLFYASTTHKMQGQSVDKAFLLIGGRLTDRAMSYVQTTRGRQGTYLFVDAPNAGDELTDLARTMQRDRRKDLAHDVAERTGTLPQLRIELDRGHRHT